MAKILLSMLLLVLLVGTISAFEFDNVKSYDIEKKELTFTNAFGFGGDIAKSTLISPQINYVMYGKDRLVAEFEVELYSDDYKEAISNIELVNNKDGKAFNRVITYKYKQVKQIEVPNLETVCINSKEVNKTTGKYDSICSVEQVGTKFKEEITWLPLEKLDLVKGKVTIGLFTDVYPDDNVEWYPTMFGVKVTEWATWTASLNVGLTAYYNMETDAGNGTREVLQGIYNLTADYSSIDFNTTNALISKSMQYPVDGITSRILSNSQINFSDTSMTLSFWVRPLALGDKLVLYLPSESSYISLNGAGNTWYVSGAGLVNAGSYGNPITTGDWYMVTWMKNGTNGNLFINGTLAHSGVSTISASQNLLFGQDGFSFKGQLDEFGVWNRSLTEAEITDLYNNGVGITYTTSFAPTLVLNSPQDYYNSSSLSNSFNVTSTVYDSTFTNWSLYTNKTGSWALESTSTTNGGIISATFTQGTYKWGCKACDSDNDCGFSENRTITIDTTAPTINITYPTGTINYGYFGQNISLNYSIVGGNYCWLEYKNDFSIYGSGLSNDTYTLHNIPSNSSYLNVSTISSGGECVPNTHFHYYKMATENCTSNIITINRSGGITKVNDFYCGNVKIGTVNTEGIGICLESLYNFSYVTKNSIPCNANSSFILGTTKALTIFSNDTLGNTNSAIKTWDYNVFENSQSYLSNIIEVDSAVLNASFDINSSPSSIILVYNGTSYIPTISIIGNTYYLSSTILSPSVNSDKNISFYYSITLGNGTINTNTKNQTVQDIGISTTCGAGAYPFVDIYNYNEETLSAINMTLEYYLTLKNNNLQISSTNGSRIGQNISLCSNKNLSSYTSTFDLELRYYTTDPSSFYETYNIQDNLGSTAPLNINLYLLNSSQGTQFKINYLDFNYIKHPGAIVQIQRQYLSEAVYRIVEIPKIADNGQAVGSFNTNNIRYKLIFIENGEVLDIFEDIFPSCQNIILGTCELDLRGKETQETETIGDFTYDLEKTNSSIILTYIIPSGTPKLITLLSTQNSRFLENISSCNTSIFASGGTITCNYNNTVGDSILNLQILTNSANPIYGSVVIAEDLSEFFLGNNYFIAFILLLSLGLMFISSATMMVLGAVIGILYLGAIFLIRGVDLVTVTSSTIWLIIAVVSIVYYISKKEDKT